MNNITPTELAALLRSGTDIQLVDVRESYEHAEFNIGGTLMPLSELSRYVEAVEKEKPVIFYCRIGIRSQVAIQRLQEKYPFKNLINLAGGLEAWKTQFPG